jgi:hypothetical protein
MVLKLDAIKDVSWQPAMQNKNGETMESCQKFQLLKKHKDACLTNGFSFVTKKTNKQTNGCTKRAMAKKTSGVRWNNIGNWA